MCHSDEGDKMHPINIDETLKTFEVIVDTREQKWLHIENALKSTRTPYERCKLNYGDYTCKAIKPNGEAVSLANGCVIERKANLDELAGNFTKGRQRFDREFQRAVGDKAKIFLLVENANWEDIDRHMYRSKFPPKSYKATLFSWQARYNITVIFCKPQQSGDIIKGILYYAMRDYLQKLKDGDEIA